MKAREQASAPTAIDEEPDAVLYDTEAGTSTALKGCGQVAGGEQPEDRRTAFEQEAENATVCVVVRGGVVVAVMGKSKEQTAVVLDYDNLADGCGEIGDDGKVRDGDGLSAQDYDRLYDTFPYELAVR